MTLKAFKHARVTVSIIANFYGLITFYFSKSKNNPIVNWRVLLGKL